MTNVKENNYKWLALVTVSMGTFMGTLDASIINVSFPRLTEIFDTDSSVVLWISVAYLLASVGLMLSFGKLGDITGRKRIYTLGFTIFTVGLILCSLSQSIIQLIAFRAVQGIGAAMIVSLSAAIITVTFPNQERGKALGILGAVVSAGLLTGPPLGGFLLDAFGWQSLFYTRVPVSIAGLTMAGVILKEQTERNTHFKFDLWGTVTLFGSLTSLLLLVNLGVKSEFMSLTVSLLSICTIVLLIMFILIERCYSISGHNARQYMEIQRSGPRLTA